MDEDILAAVESFEAAERILELIGYKLVDTVTKSGISYWNVVDKNDEKKIVGHIAINKKDYHMYIERSPIIEWNDFIPHRFHDIKDSKDKQVLEFEFENRCGVIITSGCALGETRNGGMLFVTIKKDDEIIGVIRIDLNNGIEIQFMDEKYGNKFKQRLIYSRGRYKLEEHAKLERCKYQDFTLVVEPILEKPGYIRIRTTINGVENKIDVFGTVEEWARTYGEGQNVFENVRNILNILFPFDKDEDVLSTIISKKYIEENGLSVFFDNDMKEKNGISYKKSLDWTRLFIEY